MSAAGFALVALLVVLWLLVSERAARRNISSAMALVAAGVVLSNGPLGLVEVNVHSEVIRLLAEVTLAVVLFGDASRVNLNQLRRDVAVPVRLLAVGLPLTVLFGGLVAAGLLSGTNLWVAFTIGAIVAPTDAALGAPILSDERVPESVRRTLNVESGLNDGIATPFINIFLAAAVSEGLGNGEGLGQAVRHILVGAGVGVAVGSLGGVAIRLAHQRGMMARNTRPLAVLALAALAYAGALTFHGNGFIAAFVAGLAFGTAFAEDEAQSALLTEEVGEGMTLIVWFLFGAVLLVPAVREATWQDAVFAVLALTVIRMVPVALSLIGSGLDRATVLFIGWFGPRGLASVVFTLIAVDTLDVEAGDHLLSAATLTVALSVVAHGVSASPLGRRYGASRPVDDSDAPTLRTRSRHDRVAAAIDAMPDGQENPPA